MRKLKYQKLMLTEMDRSQISKEWSIQILKDKSLWLSCQLSDAEWATSYLLSGLSLKSPKRWLGGVNPVDSLNVPNSQSIFRSHSWSIPIQNKISHFPGLIQLVHRFSLLGVRLSARNALCQWHRGYWPLILTEHIPSAFEMLQVQSQGQRFVTLITEPEQLLNEIHDGRDALSFLLHDLDHAHHFYSQPNLMKGQIGFYRLLFLAYRDGCLLEPQSHTPEWIEKMEYLISDINTHPAHFVSVFWSYARSAFNKNGEWDNSKYKIWRRHLYKLWSLSKDLQLDFDALIDGFNPEAGERVTQFLQNQVTDLIHDQRQGIFAHSSSTATLPHRTPETLILN